MKAEITMKRAQKWAKPQVNWYTYSSNTSSVTDHQTYSFLSDVWPTFQIWGRSDKDCGHYRGR